MIRRTFRIRRAPKQTQLNQRKMYLKRSKAVPIDLDVAIGLADWDVEDDSGSYIELICPHMTRCRHLSFSAFYF